MRLEILLVVVVSIMTMTIAQAYSQNPYELQRQRCDNSLNELKDFKAHPEKYPNSYQGTMDAKILDNCLQLSQVPLDPNYTMPPYVRELLERNGCLEGMSEDEINRLTSYDIVMNGCMYD